MSIGVGAIECTKCLFGLGDVCEHPGQKLERVGQGVVVELVSGLGLVDEQAGDAPEVDVLDEKVVENALDGLGETGRGPNEPGYRQRRSDYSMAKLAPTGAAVRSRQHYAIRDLVMTASRAELANLRRF